MAMTMHVNIVSAENEIYSDTAIECYAPAKMMTLSDKLKPHTIEN